MVQKIWLLGLVVLLGFSSVAKANHISAQFELQKQNSEVQKANNLSSVSKTDEDYYNSPRNFYVEESEEEQEETEDSSKKKQLSSDFISYYFLHKYLDLLFEKKGHGEIFVEGKSHAKSKRRFLLFEVFRL